MRYHYGLVCCFLLLAGCQKTTGPALVPVTGTVQMNGTPLANATVTFIPDGTTQGLGSEAVTNEAGEFKLKYRRGGDGAVVGTYKVAISKRLMPDGSEAVFDKDNPPITSPAKESLSLEYSNSQKTRLTATVPEGGTTTLDFRLQSKNAGKTKSQ